MTAHTPIGRRLAFALDARLRRRHGRLDRLEVALVHTIPAGTGWTTDWRVRARVEDLRGHAAMAQAAPAPGLRTIDHGELPAGGALDELWRWVLDTSLLHRLPGPLLSERIVFSDAAPVATIEVIRHRVLRAAAVLDRLPASLEVKTGRRREPAADALPPDAAQADAVPDAVPDAAPAQAPAAVSVVRLVASFGPREGTAGDTRVVVWESVRRPGLVALLRDCAHRLAPGSAGQPLPTGRSPATAPATVMPTISAPPSDRRS